MQAELTLLKKIRTDRKLKIADLAAIAGCTVKEYQAKEAGSEPFTWHELLKLAMSWGVSPASLVMKRD